MKMDDWHPHTYGQCLFDWHGVEYVDVVHVDDCNSVSKQHCDASLANFNSLIRLWPHTNPPLHELPKFTYDEFV